MEATVQNRRLGAPQVDDRMIDPCGIEGGHDVFDRPDPYLANPEDRPHLASHNVVEVGRNLRRPTEIYPPEAYTTGFGGPHGQ